MDARGLYWLPVNASVRNYGR
ncbi:TPA_asm: hypothetical protein, partial [ssRNA phage SRR6960509_5]